MADVFISYKSERKAAAQHLAKVLELHGYSVWFDFRLYAGKSFGPQIEKELRAAKAVVGLWCSRSRESEWVLEEAGLAKQLEKLVPAWLERVDPPLGFNSLHTIDLTRWDGAPHGGPAFYPLLDEIARLVGREPEPAYRFLRDYEESWRNLGALQLAQFHLVHPSQESERIRRLLIAAESQTAATSPTPSAGLASKHITSTTVRFTPQGPVATKEEKHDDLCQQAAAAARLAGLEAMLGITRPRTLQAGDVFKDAPFAPEMVVVPAGSFVMGSPKDEPNRDRNEGPLHEVRIAKPFAVGRFAVTFEEWDVFVAAEDYGHRPTDGRWGRGRRPVINVSWDNALAYMAWLSGKTGERYRLLTESEWEYVARAETDTPFCLGKTISTEQANYDGNHPYENGKKGEYRRKTVPVDSFGPNRFGLYNVHGNVWEWVEDRWHGTYGGAPSDGSAWIDGRAATRVLRGGSWFSEARFVRSASREKDTPDAIADDRGFRCARDLD
jgi:formylglycine-generating enzyme required for sulfatase activity